MSPNGPPPLVDILIAGGVLITMDPGRRVIPDGAVALLGDRIVEVGSAADLRAKYAARRIIDAQHKVIMPGLIDGHGHAGHGLIKALGIDRPGEWERVTEQVYTQFSTEEFWRVDAARLALERLKFGVTCGVTFFGGGGLIAGDMAMRTDDPAYGDAHCQAVAALGVREFLAVGPRRPPFPHPYAQWQGAHRREVAVDFETHLRTCETLLRRWHRQAGGRLHICLMAPVYHPADFQPASSEFAEAAGQARAIRSLAREWGALFTQDGHRQGTVRFAHQALDLLGPDALLSHAVDLSPEEIDICAAAGARIAHNPSAIASMLGRCPVIELLEAGVTVILGSDAPSPDRSCDMFRHMFQCTRYHRTLRRDPACLPEGKVLEMVTIDAARALGLEQELGSLEPGKKADVILVDTFKPHLMPFDMPVYRIVDYANGNDVDTVIVDGRVLMEGRVVASAPEAEILEAAQRVADEAIDRAGLRDLAMPPQRFWSSARL